MVVPPPTRPRHLEPGDTVAVVSPSWGGPAAFPHVYEAGLDVLRAWGLTIREYPTTRMFPEALAADARARAMDLNAAFADRAVAGIVASIGGDDSIRLLPWLDLAAIRANPKVVLGYSDTTVLLTAVAAAGVVAFHGPSVMAGIGQLAALGEDASGHVRSMLFGPPDAGVPRVYPAFERVSEGYPDWRDPSLAGRVNESRPAGPWRVLQGERPARGRLWGGCLEVLDWLRGTAVWPSADDWGDRLLLLETSEENPPPLAVRRMIRSLGVTGAFERGQGVAGVAIGRWRERDAGEIAAVEAEIREVIAHEFDRPDLLVVANLPFGHTDPQWVLPLGVMATLDGERQELRLDEAWLR
jgi:muramoyltetrapeptide carboxypeptidase LdcA involved in peptidoglycan recycling